MTLMYNLAVYNLPNSVSAFSRSPFSQQRNQLDMGMTDKIIIFSIATFPRQFFVSHLNGWGTIFCPISLKRHLLEISQYLFLETELPVSSIMIYIVGFYHPSLNFNIYLTCKLELDHLTKTPYTCII